MGSRLEQNSAAVRKRIESHQFTDEDGEEYEASSFGGLGDYFRRKKIKLQNLDVELRAAAPDKPQIFKGVVAHVMGYTQPPLHALHKDLVQHGAGFLQYLDSKTMATHIIASALPPKKVVDYNKYRMVKPQWVVDSINAGKLLPWTNYRVFDEGPRQKTLKFGEGGQMVTEISRPSQLGYREQTQHSFYTAQLQKQAASQDAARSLEFSLSPPEREGSPNSPAGSSMLGQPKEGDEDGNTDVAMTGIEMTRAALISQPAETSELGRGPGHTVASGGQGLEPALLDCSDDSPAHVKKSAQSVPTVHSDGRPMTSEEHNAMLLKDPKIWKSSTANPNFLRQFYSESRLHHLSTWKAELKSKMQKLAAEKGPARNKVVKRLPGSRRYVLHVDFDSFFCAVSLKSAPEYISKPAVVAHGTGTGSEIASCNYPAREFGVKNGMWMKRALELCPTMKVLPYDFPAYEEASQQFYDAILGVGGVVQSVSVDEALLDVTSIVLDVAGSTGSGVDEGSIWREQEKANEIASKLRDEIKQKTGCSVSVGIGPNILLAKVALRKAKPAGQYQVRSEEILSMIGELKVEDLPGVAYSLKGKLEEVGIRFVKDLRELSKARLSSMLGPKTSEKLWEYARGVDNSEVGDQPLRKSVSAEVNWGVRFVSQQDADEFVMRLCKELERRLLNEGVKGKGFTMKIMRRCLDSPLDPAKHLGHGKCDTFSKSVTFGIATYSAEIIGKEAVSILKSYNFRPGDLRGLGVQLTRLEPIKGSTSALESSQRTLWFSAAFLKTPGGKKTGAIEENGGRRQRSSSGHEMSEDPIDVDPLTPRKPRPSPMHPALALSMAREADAQARTPLNVNGTRFIIPSHPDPDIVAALPQDIRSKIMAQQRKQPPSTPPRESSPKARSGTQSPVPRDEVPSQIDPDMFNALPENMKAEVLASSGRTTAAGQALLPQSPRKDRAVARSPKRTTPTKRGGIRNTLSRARERQNDADAGLLQTNLMSVNRQEDEDIEPVDAEDEELDPEALALLPKELRREAIAEHRRLRLAQRGGLDLPVAPPPRRGAHPGGDDNDDDDDDLEPDQPPLEFPTRPPKVTFTKRLLSEVTEIKETLRLWHQDTLSSGPHQRDIVVFERYLSRVVLEERDMEKVRVLVTWLDWLVEDDDSGKKGNRAWKVTLSGIKDVVQRAVKQRGLGPMNFG